MSYGTIGLIVLAIFFMTPLSRVLLAALFGKAIGQEALSRQPDTIHLKPTDGSAFRNASRVNAVASEYTFRGFENAGTYSIAEMPGVNVQLLAHRLDSMYGVVYDHPSVGVFFDVVSRYLDGAAFTHTTAKETGLKPRPNTRMVNRPGSEAGPLIETHRRDRTQSGLKPCSTASAVNDFETAYAEYMAWIKQRGISTGEVVEVAKRKAA